MGVLRIGALLFGVHTRVFDFWKLPHSDILIRGRQASPLAFRNRMGAVAFETAAAPCHAIWLDVLRRRLCGLQKGPDCLLLPRRHHFKLLGAVVLIHSIYPAGKGGRGGYTPGFGRRPLFCADMGVSKNHGAPQY